MATIETRQFGTLTYAETDVFEFPDGLPGFEGCRRFLCIERAALRPVTFLQSLDDPAICFITLPAQSVDPRYELHLTADDLQILGLADMRESLACLAIVCLPAGEAPTANLLGPVVLSRETMRGVQAIREDNRYSALHPLKVGSEGSGSSLSTTAGEKMC